MLTDDSLVEIKLRFMQLCTVHLVGLVETMIDAIAAQKFGYALKGIRTGELKGRTLVQLLPVGQWMIITLGLIAVGLVAAIQTIVDAIAHLHVPITTNGLAKTLTMTAFMFAGKLIRVVAEKERR